MAHDLEHKAVVGDDGELLEEDLQVDLEVYIDFAFGDLPLQLSRWQQVNRFVGSNRLLIIMTLFVGAVLLSAHLTPPAAKGSVAAYAQAARVRATAIPRATPSWGIPAESKVTNVSAEANISQVRWSPYGIYIAFQAASNKLTLWSVGLNKFVTTSFDEQSLFDWEPSGHYLDIFLRQQLNKRYALTATRFQLIPGSIQNTKQALPQIEVMQNPKQMVKSSLNQTLLLAQDGYSFDLIDARAASRVISRKLDAAASDVDWISDSGRFSVVTSDGLSKWIPTSTHPYESWAGTFQQASWSPDGLEVVVSHDNIHDRQHQPGISVLVFGTPQPKWSQLLVLGSTAITSANDFNVQVAWAPKGNRIATFVENDTAIDVWDAETGRHLRRLLHEGAVNSIDWSPNGAYLAIGSAGGLFIWSPTW